MGLFGLSKKVATFGLDIGSSAVKVVELVPGKTGYALKSFAMVALPREAITEGSVRQPAVVTDAIRECVQRAGITSPAAVISVSGRDSIVKRVPLPKVSAKELADAIYLEAEHHIPFAIDDVFLDYQVMGESANSMSVLLVATKKVKVLEYIAVGRGRGPRGERRRPRRVRHPEPVRARRPRSTARGGGPHRHRRIGDEDQRDPRRGIGLRPRRAVRRQQLHGRHRPAARHPVDRAEAAKRGHEVGVNWDDLVPALEAVSRELSLEVQRTFDYFASTAESERIGKIVLSGGCARLAGIESFLVLVLGGPRGAGAAVLGRRGGPRPAPAEREELRSADCLLAVAVGLGLRQAWRQAGMIRINLAPPPTKKARPSFVESAGFNLGLAVRRPLRRAHRRPRRLLVEAVARRSRGSTARSRQPSARRTASRALIAEGQRYKREKEELESRVNAIERSPATRRDPRT